MPLILSGNVASATADAGYTVDNSCRFNKPSDDSLTRTFGSSGNRKTWSFSTWIKRCNLINANMNILGTAYTVPSGEAYLLFRSGEQLHYGQYTAGGVSENHSFQTNQAFRDQAAWYNLLFVWDTTQSTSSDRMKLYVNGTQVTSFASSTYPTLNLDGVMNSNKGHYIGDAEYGTNLDGYLSETIFVDGTALSPTDVGEFDSSSPTIWKPIDVSGLTFGTNGYYLDFEDSSNLGNDANGGTDFTVTNLAAADQSTDTPTNNFCVMNPLDNYYANATLSEGNLKMVSGSSRECSSTATIALSNGKWFWEYEVTTMSAPFGGIQPIPSFGNTASAAVLQTNGLGYLKTGKVETTDGSGGSTELASYATYAANDIIGVALDLDAATNIIYFYKNGALQGSGVNLTHVDSTANGHYLIAFGAISGQDTFEINFGNPITALDSANADANGYGAFEYAVPSGFFSICTKNLAEYG